MMSTDVGCEQSSSLHARSVLQNELRRVQQYLAQQGVFVRSRLTLHTRLRAKKNASALQDDFSRAFHWLFALGPVYGYNALGCPRFVCAQRRWVNPPLDVMFADGLTAEEAEALLGADGGGLPPESSDSFLSAISDEFYDVYSDAYYDTGTP